DGRSFDLAGRVFFRGGGGAAARPLRIRRGRMASDGGTRRIPFHSDRRALRRRPDQGGGARRGRIDRSRRRHPRRRSRIEAGRLAGAGGAGCPHRVRGSVVSLPEILVASGRIPGARRASRSVRGSARDDPQVARAAHGRRELLARLGAARRLRSAPHGRVARRGAGPPAPRRPRGLPRLRLPARQGRSDRAAPMDGSAGDAAGALGHDPGSRSPDFDATPFARARWSFGVTPESPAIAKRTRLAILVAFLFNAIYFPEFFPPVNGPNELSRIEAFVAFVEHGTFAIDSTIRKYGDHQDKSVYGGHSYSNKAPGLIFACAAVYRVLRIFAVQPSNPRAPLFVVVRLLTVTLVSLLALARFSRRLAREP